jgi:hypothetical protein
MPKTMSEHHIEMPPPTAEAIERALEAGLPKNAFNIRCARIGVCATWQVDHVEYGTILVMSDGSPAEENYGSRYIKNTTGGGGGGWGKCEPTPNHLIVERVLLLLS